MNKGGPIKGKEARIIKNFIDFEEDHFFVYFLKISLKQNYFLSNFLNEKKIGN